MIQSMTGYGKAEINLKNTNFTIEVRSLNSKQIDANGCPIDTGISYTIILAIIGSLTIVVLGILVLIVKRKKNQPDIGEDWETLSWSEYETQTETIEQYQPPVQTQISSSGPPIYDKPVDWTIEQWNQYGEQYLLDKKQQQITTTQNNPVQTKKPNRPPFGLKGDMDGQYEVCEYPAGSGSWWWKDYDNRTWVKWE